MIHLIIYLRTLSKPSNFSGISAIALGSILTAFYLYDGQVSVALSFS
ncbi:MAG: hypothetical protein WBB82_05165 [Limnothrix sp.]